MKNMWHHFKTPARFLTLTLLFAASTFAFAQKSHAQEASVSSCKPVKNLLPDFIKKHPDTYQKLQSEAEKTPNHSGLLWKVTKPDVKTSYLFGTMHLSDPRISNAPTQVLELLDKSETIIIETTDVLDPAFINKILSNQPDLIQMQGNDTLSKLFSDEEQLEIRQQLSKRNLSLAAFDKFQPWIVTNLLSIPQCESVHQAQGKVALDMILAKRAQEQDKDLVGLETAAEQLEAMKTLPMEFHHKGLLASVRSIEEIDDFVETLTHLYLEGRIGLMAPVLQALDEDGLNDEDYQKFEEIMINKRTHNMVERGLTFFNHGDVFMAVGALHLPGEDGLLELLRAHGFTVENVSLN